ncbi:UNKNOWN [Stylonychia lemnae]|uniref:Uncharacterized protein n=1 Tax=Stylonychia lemnae TaxID=5949 RepID=A0A078ANT1_STYLE|nr:UNKNOWN [Stylonychia lemnae]|eukprot:CDW83819.1 UNKNOWN [Stylonychia lemnae]
MGCCESRPEQQAQLQTQMQNKHEQLNFYFGNLGIDDECESIFKEMDKSIMGNQRGLSQSITTGQFIKRSRSQGLSSSGVMHKKRLPNVLRINAHSPDRSYQFADHNNSIQREDNSALIRKNPLEYFERSQQNINTSESTPIRPVNGQQIFSLQFYNISNNCILKKQQSVKISDLLQDSLQLTDRSNNLQDFSQINNQNEIIEELENEFSQRQDTQLSLNMGRVSPILHKHQSDKYLKVPHQKPYFIEPYKNEQSGGVMQGGQLGSPCKPQFNEDDEPESPYQKRQTDDEYKKIQRQVQTAQMYVGILKKHDSSRNQNNLKKQANNDEYYRLSNNQNTLQILKKQKTLTIQEQQPEYNIKNAKILTINSKKPINQFGIQKNKSFSPGIQRSSTMSLKKY